MRWGLSITASARFGVEGGEEGVFGTGVFQVGNEVPKGSCLVVVSY